MRAVLPLALMLAFAGTAQAQERAQPEQNERPAAVQVQQAPAPVVQQATTQGEMKVSPEEARRIIYERPEPMEAAMQGPESRNWWWLVGAIVLGGVILAALVR
jgi:hypothetical protein